MAGHQSDIVGDQGRIRKNQAIKALHDKRCTIPEANQIGVVDIAVADRTDLDTLPFAFNKGVHHRLQVETGAGS